MRLELSLLVVFLAYVASDAYNGYFPEEQYPYYYNNPYYKSRGGNLKQLLFSVGLPGPVRQTTVTTVTVTATVRPSISRPPQTSIMWTSVSTITCTMSTNVPCSVKTAKPSLMEGSHSFKVEDQHQTTEDEEQFDKISSSAVQKVETTKVPHFNRPNAKLPLKRKGRAVTEAQWVPLFPDFSEDYSENQPHIQPAFNSEPFDHVALPFFRRYSEPAISQQRQSSFLNLLGNFFSRNRTTFTVFEIETFTLTPTCSVAGPIPQCPNV